MRLPTLREKIQQDIDMWKAVIDHDKSRIRIGDNSEFLRGRVDSAEQFVSGMIILMVLYDDQ